MHIKSSKEIVWIVVCFQEFLLASIHIDSTVIFIAPWWILCVSSCYIFLGTRRKKSKEAFSWVKRGIGWNVCIQVLLLHLFKEGEIVQCISSFSVLIKNRLPAFFMLHKILFVDINGILCAVEAAEMRNKNSLFYAFYSFFDG